MRLNTAITESEGDEESEGLVAGLKAKRNKIMTILHRAEDEEIPEMLRNYEKIESKEILKTVSINEAHKMELSIILKAKNYRDALNGVYKEPRRKSDNKFTNFFRNFKYFHGKLEDASPSAVNRFAKNIIEKCEIIEIRSWQVSQKTGESWERGDNSPSGSSIRLFQILEINSNVLEECEILTKA